MSKKKTCFETKTTSFREKTQAREAAKPRGIRGHREAPSGPALAYLSRQAQSPQALPRAQKATIL